MSFQSQDSDEFSLFSTGSCSPGVDSTSPQYSSVEYPVNENSGAERNSRTAIMDGALYREILETNFESKEEGKREDADCLLGNVGWRQNDFISTSTTSTTTSVNKSPIVTYQTMSAAVSSSSTKVSWNTSGTSSVPETVSWNTQGTSITENVTFTLDDDSDLLQQKQEPFSDTYDRVYFDRLKPQNSQLHTQQTQQNSSDLQKIPALSQLQESNPCGLQNINSQCYEAAISEHFKRKKHPKLGHYVSKIKNSKAYSGNNSQVYEKRHQRSPAQSPTSSKPPGELAECPLTGHLLENDPAPRDTNVTESTFTTFTIPSIPSPLSPFSATAHSPSHDGQRSPKALKDPDLKKYRYNQTALALQQSGLMKTTIKTAELLRKSRLLQQELTKLRRETVVFVHAVLNNPENKHLKDMYMVQQKDKSITQ